MPKKVTHADHVARLVADGRGFVALDAYINSTTPIRHRCLEGHEWPARPNNIIIRGTGCPHCSGHAVAPYPDRLVADGRGFIALDEYVNSYTPIRHRCLEGHEWRTRPYSILRGHGCPHCAGHRPPPYPDRLVADGRGFVALDAYINSSTPIRHRCPAGHEWRAKPHSIINQGSGCPDCAEYGFNPSKPAWFYTFELHSGLLKIGVTNCDKPQDRYGAKDLAFMHLCRFGTRLFKHGTDALAIETEAKRRLKPHSYTGPSPFSDGTLTTEVYQPGALLVLLPFLRSEGVSC